MNPVEAALQGIKAEVERMTEEKDSQLLHEIGQVHIWVEESPLAQYILTSNLEEAVLARGLNRSESLSAYLHNQIALSVHLGMLIERGVFPMNPPKQLTG